MPEIVSQRLCKKCNALKSPTEFYRNKKHPDGLFYDCKQCWIKKSTEYNRRAKGSEVCRKARKKYYSTENGIQKRRLAIKREAISHKQERRVRRALIKQVWRGKIARPSICSKCGIECKPEAHHYTGYAWENRFEVQWLCFWCHKKAEGTALPFL